MPPHSLRPNLERPSAAAAFRLLAAARLFAG
jgi:hypothetical protein